MIDTTKNMEIIKLCKKCGEKIFCTSLYQRAATKYCKLHAAESTKQKIKIRKMESRQKKKLLLNNINVKLK